MLKLLFIILALSSCQKREPKKPQQVNEAVVAKAELYKRLHTGWAHGRGCDSVGFSALCRLAGGCKDVVITDAEGEPGRWYRNPEKDCYPDKSKSDISKDMFMMLFPYLYATGDKQNLREIYEYGKENGWIMGRGYISRTFMTPPMVFLLQRMIGFSTSEIPQSSKQVEKAGFEKHLDAISLMLKGMIGEGLDPIQYEEIRQYAQKNPQNALFQALYNKYRDGNQSIAIEILKNEKYFPSDRLPTSADRCEEYLWQRDLGADWEPCEEGKTHDGVDFLLAAYVAGQI
jgi:hypothetical protein